NWSAGATAKPCCSNRVNSVSVASWLATSPQRWPPIPSARTISAAEPSGATRKPQKSWLFFRTPALVCMAMFSGESFNLRLTPQGVRDVFRAARSLRGGLREQLEDDVVHVLGQVGVAGAGRLGRGRKVG